ncbi:MAG: NAD(P)-dependent oxidoreductase [Candidatus Lokiarchaeota archaeon]|nr:NAD(P)-dependent oxidoreductase [Candidatus Lokiarchaeota archaeon]
MKILLTGAFGIVGLKVLDNLVKENDEIKCFDIKTHENWLKSKKYKKRVNIYWGDIQNKRDLKEAMEDIDIVIHLAAIIPPLADKNPNLAKNVNIGGTNNLIEVMESQNRKPRLIYTSSIAIYGDRRNNPLIFITDCPNPNRNDLYAQQKLECEKLIKKSNLDWVIFRLTYIVSLNKLKMDPLMFEMPLETKIEICDANDVGLAIANAIKSKNIWKKVFHIAGGEKCRTTYKEYLENMFEIFGLGKKALVEEAFSKNEFHCGYMDTAESQFLLHYQNYSLENYYEDVKQKLRFLSFFIKIFRYFALNSILHKSKYYQEFIKSKR